MDGPFDFFLASSGAAESGSTIDSWMKVRHHSIDNSTTSGREVYALCSALGSSMETGLSPRDSTWAIFSLVAVGSNAESLETSPSSSSGAHKRLGVSLGIDSEGLDALTCAWHRSAVQAE